MRRKCLTDCIFAPYFDSEQSVSHFAIVHKVFDLNYVSKLLCEITDHHKRLDAIKAIVYEAQVRVDDPIYGCCGRILTLQEQLRSLQEQVQYQQQLVATRQLPVTRDFLSLLDKDLSSSSDNPPSLKWSLI